MSLNCSNFHVNFEILESEPFVVLILVESSESDS